MNKPTTEKLTTAEVAREAGVNLQTVRYYERRGLLPAPPRRPSGYREYDDAYVRRIRFIKRAQDLGFTLAEVEELLSLRASPGAASLQVRRRAEEKLREVDARIRDLHQIRRTLQDLAASCDGTGTTDECPILQALDGMETHDMETHEHCVS